MYGVTPLTNIMIREKNFKDFETSNWTWDPAVEAYYWHRFYSFQPDLNYDNPKVQEEIF